MKRRPGSDPASIGRLLQNLGMKRSQLNEAVAYQKEHPKLRLGEICVKLGFVRPDKLHIAVSQQRAIRQRSVGQLVDVATKRTRKMARDTSALFHLSADALSKLHDSDN